mmetsp:Transcript_19434/g.65178  ORF Transcript_19434/g.65178 Transcript_19434/m.65178 type:complete len:405 (-) Transcript_19434:81-1295(-)
MPVLEGAHLRADELAQREPRRGEVRPRPAMPVRRRSQHVGRGPPAAFGGARRRAGGVEAARRGPGGAPIRQLGGELPDDDGPRCPREVGVRGGRGAKVRVEGVALMHRREELVQVHVQCDAVHAVEGLGRHELVHKESGVHREHHGDPVRGHVPADGCVRGAVVPEEVHWVNVAARLVEHLHGLHARLVGVPRGDALDDAEALCLLVRCRPEPWLPGAVLLARVALPALEARGRVEIEQELEVVLGSPAHGEIEVLKMARDERPRLRLRIRGDPVAEGQPDGGEACGLGALKVHLGHEGIAVLAQPARHLRVPERGAEVPLGGRRLGRRVRKRRLVHPPLEEQPAAKIDPTPLARGGRARALGRHDAARGQARKVQAVGQDDPHDADHERPHGAARLGCRWHAR